MVTRIDIEVTGDGSSATVLIAGDPAGTRRVVTSVQSGPMRHAVWIDGECQYDVEVYLNGRLEAKVAPRTAFLEQAYDELGPPPSDDPGVHSPAQPEGAALRDSDVHPPSSDADLTLVPGTLRRWTLALRAGWLRDHPLPRFAPPG